MEKKYSRPLKRVFQYFRSILELNNKVLEEIANAEKVLGGNYLFDKAFLASFVTKVCETTREVIYNLNSLSNGSYLVLYDILESIRFNLEDIVSGGAGPFSNRLTLSYTEINRDLDDIVGAKNANLADIYNNFQIKVPDGFAITKQAYLLFLDSNNIIPQIEAMYDKAPSSEDLGAELEAIFNKARVPDELKVAVYEELISLFKRLGREKRLAVRSSAIGEDTERSFAGQFHSILNVEPDQVLDAYKKVIMARFMPHVKDYIGHASDLLTTPVAVGVQEMIDAQVSGVTYTMDPLGQSKDCLVISAVEGMGEKLVGGHHSGDQYLAKRAYPFSLISSLITEKSIKHKLPPGKEPLEMVTTHMRRGSSLLDVKTLKKIAEAAMLCEKAFGNPRDLEWAINEYNEFIILQNRRLGIQSVPEPMNADIEKILRKFPVIMDGLGQTAQLGIASGRVVFVHPDDDPENVPVGAIIVAKYAHPKLSRVLKKASAILTDVGSSTGHLATIAREYRVPAIFGTGKATQLLKDGMEVTVDADEKRVYEGIIEELVEVEARRDWEYLEEPEIKILRRILSYVSPLYLVDPTSKDFLPEKCKTIHDIIHFCHVKAVESLIEQFSSLKSFGKEQVLELKASIPIKINVIDIGSGVEADDSARAVSPEQIRSVPFKALLTGLLRKEAWDTEPAPFGLGDLFSSMVRPVSMLTNPPEYSGQNLAIVASDYMNLSLLLGYHFNVIDSYVCTEPDNNYIYFRFAGGFAEESKRRKRAELLRWILESLGFKAETRKDIVIGKLKGVEDYEIVKTLQHIGELIAFTRQLDVRMADEQAVERFFHKFVDLCGASCKL